MIVVLKPFPPSEMFRVHVYSPSSSFSTSDIARLLVYLNPESDPVIGYASSLLMTPGPPHVSDIDCRGSTRECNVASQIRITEELMSRTPGGLAVMVTVGLGTNIQRDVCEEEFVSETI